MIIGILYLPVEPLASDRWLAEFRTLAIGVAVIASVLLVIIVAALYRLKKSKVIHGDEEFAEVTGIVNDTIDPEGLIKVKGELWRAKSKDSETIPEGEKVRIIKREGMVCIVEKEEKKKE